MTQAMGNLFLIILFEVKVGLLPKWESFLSMNMRKFIAEHNPTPKMMGAELVPQAKWESKRGLILVN